MKLVSYLLLLPVLAPGLSNAAEPSLTPALEARATIAANDCRLELPKVSLLNGTTPYIGYMRELKRTLNTAMRYSKQPVITNDYLNRIAAHIQELVPSTSPENAQKLARICFQDYLQKITTYGDSGGIDFDIFRSLSQAKDGDAFILSEDDRGLLSAYSTYRGVMDPIPQEKVSSYLRLCTATLVYGGTPSVASGTAANTGLTLLDEIARSQK